MVRWWSNESGWGDWTNELRLDGLNMEGLTMRRPFQPYEVDVVRRTHDDVTYTVDHNSVADKRVYFEG